jgi:e3 binding domain
MASQKSKPNGRRSGGGPASQKGRSASQKPEQYRFAQNVDGEETVAEHEYRAHAADARKRGDDDPDVLLDVPVVKVDSIHLEVEDLQVQVALQAKVLDLLEVDVGVEAHLDKLKVDLKGVEAQALLKVRLDYVAAIIDRVMTTLDRNPKLVDNIGKSIEQVGEGSGEMLDSVGEGVGDAAEGAGGALEHVGGGAGQAVGEVGEGAGQVAGQLGESVGQAAGQLQGGGGEEMTGPKIAKVAARTVAKEIGAAASDEAKEIGIAATRKLKKMGERRRTQRAERHHATPAAMSAAAELEIDLDDVEGTGADGRITVGDVRKAATEE